MHGEHKDLFAARQLGEALHGAPAVEAKSGAVNLILCADHGPSQFCHVNANGEHVDPSYCQCGRLGMGPAACPIDAHNPLLAVGLEISARELSEAEKSARLIRAGLCDARSLFEGA